MSSLFERAIADAKELKETALRNAEQQLIEKYSSELKGMVENLLEQDEEEPTEMDMAQDEEAPAEEEEMSMDMEVAPEPTGDETLVDQVPDAATIALAQALEDDEEEIVIDFDELMADYEASTPEGEAMEVPEGEPEVSRDELLDQTVDTTEEELDEALDSLTEEQLDALLEEVNVDIKSVHPTNGWAGSTAGDRAENAELVAIAAAMEELQKEHNNVLTKLKQKNAQITKLTESLDKNKAKLNSAKQILSEMTKKTKEVNLQNARLYYTTQVLSSQELNTRQKDKIVESLAKAKTIEETKIVYETLKDSVGSTKEQAPESLVEAVNRTRSLVVGSRQREDKQQEQSPMFKNWRKLAGIEK